MRIHEKETVRLVRTGSTDQMYVTTVGTAKLDDAEDEVKASYAAAPNNIALPVARAKDQQNQSQARRYLEWQAGML